MLPPPLRRSFRALAFTGLAGLAALYSQPATRAAAQATAAATAAPPAINGIFVSAAGTQYRDALRTEPFCLELRQQPFEAVILQVRYEGEAFYNSQLMPRALGVEASYDPLASILRQLHAPAKQGLQDNGQPKKVFAWIDPYQLPNAKNPAGINPQNAARLHPDWLSRRADGSSTDADGNQYLEPCLTDVQLHLEQMISELVRQYPIDGLVIDGVADPAGDGRWGFHPAVLAQFQKMQGRPATAETPDPQDPAWIKFRSDLLSQAAAGFVQAAHQARPNLLVALTGEATGPAPAAPEQFNASSVYLLRHQDWPAWLGRGAAGVFFLKDFRADRSGSDDFDAWMKLALWAGSQQGVRVVNSVAGASNESVDALSQLRRSMAGGAGGVALSDFAMPVSDVSARQLFMNAVQRAVLSPTQPRLHLPIPDQLTSGTTAIAGAEPFRLKPIMRPTGAIPGTVPTPVAPRATPRPSFAPPTGEHLDLPPPPPLNEVVDEGEGRLIPAHGPVGTTALTTSTRALDAASRTGDRTLHAINSLAGMDLTGSAVNRTPPAPPSQADADAQQRKQMLNEILSTTPPGDSATDSLAADPQALDELRKKFGNIF